MPVALPASSLRQSTFLAALGAALLAIVVSLLALPSENSTLATVAFAISSVATTICFVPLLLSLSVAMAIFGTRNNFMGLSERQACVGTLSH